jgi:hypothetical protein
MAWAMRSIDVVLLVVVIAAIAGPGSRLKSNTLYAH